MTVDDTTGPFQELAARTRSIAAGLDDEEPDTRDHDAVDAAARRALKHLSDSGLTTHAVPAPGAPVSARSLCAIREELAAVSGLADAMFVMQGLGSCLITLGGSGAMKTRFLPDVARGASIAAFALTEPEAGSDVGGISTRAVRDGGDYVLDGTKTYISNAGIADVYTVLARTGEGPSRRDGISAFVVEAATPGLTVRRRLSIIAPHPIGTIEFSGCRVPSTHLLGDEGEGYDLALAVLDRFRPTVGAAANGFARRALAESLSRSRQRRQFGRSLSEFQAIRFKLADMATWLDAARLLVQQAATLVDSGASLAQTRRASAMAKLYATEAAQRIVDEAVQIHGALGVTHGHVVERLYREVRALRIYEGTSEIQRSIIARALLANDA